MKKIAIITGSRRGIGKGIAHSLGMNGYTVVLSATKDEADDVLAEFRAEGIDCIYVKCDVTSTADREHLVDYVCDTYGRIDVLVNNAGVAPLVRGDLLAMPEESWDRVVKTNARSMFFMTQYVAKKMIEFQKQDLEDYKPRIISMSSISAYTSSTNRGEYCISKAAISMTTLLYADRLAEYNIPVFEVRPGMILTDMMSASKEKFGKLIEGGLLPIKRWGYPEDVGNCVLALCSGLLDYATGQVINADGGFHIRRL